MNGLQDDCYVLVRVARHREAASMPTIDDLIPGQVQIDDAVQKHIDDINVGDSPSVLEFIRSFGSHYITSFTTGNALYQVIMTPLHVS